MTTADIFGLVVAVGMACVGRASRYLIAMMAAIDVATLMMLSRASE
jgi:hypothetical protein